MKNIGVTIGATACGLCAGIFLASNGINNAFSRTLALAGLISIPSVYIAHLLIDSHATNRINESDNRLSKTLSDRDECKSRLTDIELANTRLSNELANVKTVLTQTTQERDIFSATIATLNPSVQRLESELHECQKRIGQLEAEIIEWESQFENHVEDETNKRFQKARHEEIQRVFDEHDSITSEAMMLCERLRSWGVKVAHGHQTKREIITSLATQYNNNLDTINESLERERANYIEQIELLNEKVGRLQHRLNGDLIEPEYGQFGYAVEGKIANDIARRVWDDLQIPLSVKGYHVKQDGSVDIGYGYSHSISVESLLTDLSRHSSNIAKWLGIHKITAIRKLEIADVIVLTFRREPAIKDETVKLIAGTADEFIAYITSHSIRYRLIADPGEGKTPTTAVMVSEILKVGGTRGNTGKGKKIPHTLVSVSCPDVQSSQKDADYPLETFLQYGNTTAALKSIDAAIDDWNYRKRDTSYADNFFQLWVWDELDNTLNSASDPKAVGESFKQILKQCHHTGVGWIVSGQSVMTSQIPGFMDDDRELFTQIIIGTSKIRKYLEKYGKKVLSAKIISQLTKNLDDLEAYIDDKNAMITDAARLFRLALVLDDKSPKLYFLPNLDNVKFDAENNDRVIMLAAQMKRQFLAKTIGGNVGSLVNDGCNAYPEGNGEKVTNPPFPTIGGSDQSNQSNQIPHCLHCGGNDLKLIDNGKRYQCKGCTKRFVTSKAVWR